MLVGLSTGKGTSPNRDMGASSVALRDAPTGERLVFKLDLSKEYLSGLDQVQQQISRHRASIRFRNKSIVSLQHKNEKEEQEISILEVKPLCSNCCRRPSISAEVGVILPLLDV